MLDNGAAGGGPTVGGDLTWADLDLSNWRRYGKDRLYISARGRDLGYLDNQTGELHVADADMGPVLHDLLRHHLVEAKAVTAAAPAKPRRAAPPNAGWQEGVAKATRERGNTLSESALWHELENGSPFTWERELVWGS